MGIKICAAGIAGVIAFAATSSGADPLTCLNETGYVFQDSGSAIRLDGGIVYAFPPPSPDAYCDPPLEDEVAVSAEGGAGVLNYRVGFGLQVATGAIASKDVSGTSEGRAEFAQTWAFTVIPDDPESSDPMPITITALHRFGRVRAESNDLGLASNGHIGRYDLRAFSVSGPQVVFGGWNSEGSVMTENESFQIQRDVDVPVNVSLFLFATLEHRSSAHASPSGTMGSGSAEAAATVTYEVSTEAAATILFDVETKLGLAAPMLDVVSVPEPAPGSLQLIALACMGALWRSWRHA